MEFMGQVGRFASLGTGLNITTSLGTTGVFYSRKITTTRHINLYTGPFWEGSGSTENSSGSGSSGERPFWWSWSCFKKTFGKTASPDHVKVKCP
jgi:hypothetical protein